MFSNLASYLGYATPSAKAPQLETAPTDVRLRAVEEDEWVLVERNENERSIAKKKEVDEDSEMTRVTLAVSTCPGTLPGSSKDMSRSASLDILSPLQESWYLTPPPSFTFEGPIHMETSPLENLLIEHPSMSVYERSQNADVSRKMSNSSPSSTGVTEERPALSPIQERMYKVPQTNLVPQTQESGDLEEEKSKGPKMKNFVKSPRRSMNSEMQNLPKKTLRKRPETLGSELISKSSATKEAIREEETSVVPVQTRRLYSEVLAGKPKASLKPVQTQPEPTPTKPEEVKPEPTPGKENAGATETATENESVMSVEEESSEESSEERDRRKAIQTLPDRQHRLHYLNSSAQKQRKVGDFTKKNNIRTPVAEAREEKASGTEAAAENESVMSVEEESSEESSDRSEGRDRRKAIQSLPDRQHRLHFLNRSAQKVEQRKVGDLMKKNNITRTNKAREFNFRNMRQRRADMMQRHSGANNNRKCMKTTLY